MSSVADLKFLKRVVVDAEKALQEEEVKFADEHSKLKIGDVVKVTGWTHVGKDMIVEKIFFSESYIIGECGIVATGPVLKKDQNKSAYIGCHLELKVELNH